MTQFTPRRVCFWVLLALQVSCGAAISSEDVENNFDPLVILSGTIGPVSSNDNGDTDRVRLSLVTVSGDGLEVLADTKVEQIDAGSYHFTLRIRSVSSVLEEASAVAGFVLYEDVNENEALDRVEVGSGCNEDSILGVAHRHSVRLENGSWEVWQYPLPCFPTFDCEVGSSIPPVLNKWSRPMFEELSLQVGADPGPPDCVANEGLIQFGVCHRLRHLLFSVRDSTCSPWDPDCSPVKGRPIVASHWHHDLLRDLDAHECCPLPLDKNPWRCNPVLGCPNGFHCCSGTCDAQCSQSESRRWIAVPAGKFTMGSPVSEPCRNAMEETQFLAVLSTAFAISQSETLAWDFEGVSGHFKAPDMCQGELCPAADVTWHEAASYCNRLSILAGLDPCYLCSGNGPGVACGLLEQYKGSNFYNCAGYRLPTEAEWEYAYRAGTRSSLYNGELTGCLGSDSHADAIAWYGNEISHAHPVCGKNPNPWGLCDMAGNVEEWVQDTYAIRPTYLVGNTTGVVVDPLGDTATYEQAAYSGKFHRGGAWGSAPGLLRAARRLATTSPGQIGFRCVRSLK